MHVKVLIFLGLAALAAAGSSEEYIYRRPQRHSEESDESYESGEAQYAFDWAVRHESSENDFGHQESRDGDETQGSYYVRLPDTRLQKVTYRVEGDSGYVADVSYEGEAQFPDSYESRESDEAYRRYYSSGSNESK
ncbi:pro-resilin-like [Macrobrachium nipponense]|uniref:pro-resilin-like n=1 Tax=Macrobrachium nipponense TaxID=159736 RepID=UPI0030C7F7DB